MGQLHTAARAASFSLGGLGNRREDVETDLDLRILVERNVALGRGNTNRLARAGSRTTLAEIHLDRELGARDRHLDVFHDSVFLVVVEWEAFDFPLVTPKARPTPM
jgi:hypothetical protein